MQDAIKNLLLAISNGLGFKSVGYCFYLLELHTYIATTTTDKFS